MNSESSNGAVLLFVLLTASCHGGFENRPDDEGADAGSDSDARLDAPDSDYDGDGSQCPLEFCGNFLDDDCDGLVDWDDSDCPNGLYCDTTIPLVTPGIYHGMSAGEASSYRGSCGGDGDEIIYSLSLTETSSLHVDTLGTSFDTVLYLREADCTQGVEIVCSDDDAGDGKSQIDLFALQPGTYYLFVDGDERSDHGELTLNVHWTAVSCGNGFPEPGEACDDGNLDEADTCTPECQTTGAFALAFDGSNDWVQVEHDEELDIVDDLTVELWFTANTVPRLGSPLVRKGFIEASYYLWIGGDGTLFCGIYAGGNPRILESTESVLDGLWHHVALVRDGSTLLLFLDGEIVDSRTGLTANTDSNSRDVYIGNAKFWSLLGWEHHWLDGAIDELRISRDAMYLEDFTPLPRLDLTESTVALWHFDDGLGEYAADSSPNSFTAVVHGCTWIDGLE